MSSMGSRLGMTVVGVLALCLSAVGQSVEHVASTVCQVREIPTGMQTTGWIASRWQARDGVAHVVITNRHLISSHMKHPSHADRYSVHYNGRKYPAARLQSSGEADLAAFAFIDAQSHPYATIGVREAPRGSLVQSVGFPYFVAGNRKTYVVGRVRGGPLHAIEASFKSESGQSGSPVVEMSTGHVVGCVWGKCDPVGPSDAIYVGCQPIRSFLRHVLGCAGLPPGYSPQPIQPSLPIQPPAQPQLPAQVMPAPRVQPELQQSPPVQIQPIQPYAQLQDSGEMLIQLPPIRLRWTQPDPRIQVIP